MNILTPMSITSAIPLSFSDRILADAHTLERTMQGDAPNRTGTFYTPPWLAILVAQRSIAPKIERRSLAELRRLRILDPACGSGIMLLVAIDLLAQRLALLGRYAELPALAAQILSGIDRNPLAVDATCGLLSRSIIERGLDPIPFDKIYCGDALLNDPATIFGCATRFDVVLGNPPYGLARGEQLSPEDNAALKRIFHASRAGRVNKYLAFMARGFELLRPGGVLTLVVPNSWLGIREADGIRRLLLRAGAIHEITILPAETFGALGVETVIVTARRDVPTRSFILRRTTIGPEIAPRPLTLSELSSRVPPVISIAGGRGVDGVWETLDQHPSLTDPIYGLTPRIALQAYATGKGTPPQSPEVVRTHPFHSTEPRGPDYLPYFKGRDIGRYTTTWSGTYLRHGPWLAEPQRLDFFRGSRIVLREILGARPYLVRGAFIDTPVLYNKSVLHILGTDPLLLRAVLAVLNSRFTSFVLLTRGRKGARALFPKLLNDDLKRIPLPRQLLEARSELTRLVEEIEREGATPARNAQIDRRVYALYELTPSQIAIVERTTAERTPVTPQQR